MAGNDGITEEDLSKSLRHTSSKEASSTLMSVRSLKEAVEEVERRLILQALQAHQQNQLRAAKALCLSRQGLIKKMKRYGIRAS